MANASLKTIVHKGEGGCNLIQPDRGQKKCISCGKELDRSEFTAAPQRMQPPAAQAAHSLSQ